MSDFSLPSLAASNGFIHFIGCGGAGTAPLMRLFHGKGFSVSGSDLIDNVRTQELRKMGLSVSTGHRPENLPSGDPEKILVVYTSAAGDDNPELAEAKRRGIRCVTRGAALAFLAESFERTVCISGSHGKTSVSAMIAWILQKSGIHCGALVGGSVPGWNENGDAGDGKLLVSEVDESDGTHTLIHSTLGIVTNVEDDHAWSVGGWDALKQNFCKFAEKSEHLFYSDSINTTSLFQSMPQAEQIDPEGLWTEFLPHFEGKVPCWGHFQKVDAMFAVKAAEFLGIPLKTACRALCSFPGVDRRMSLRFENDFVRIIEDYAHHPTELRESLSALREMNPGRRLIVIFQPHRYARLERYFQEFAGLLATADAAYVTPVFAAWTGKGKYASEDLAHAAGPHGVALSGSWQDMAETVASKVRRNDLIAVIGAGDLPGILDPLKLLLTEKGCSK